MCRYHLLKSGGCWYAAGITNSPSFHIPLISPVLLPALHFSEPLCHSCSTLASFFPLLQLKNCIEAIVLPPRPWALLGGGWLHESVQLLGAESRQWAMVITCHSSQRFPSLSLTIASKKAYSLCVILAMIQPSVHMDTALSCLPAHKHSPHAHARIHPLHTATLKCMGTDLYMQPSVAHSGLHLLSEFWFSALRWLL